MPTNQQVVNGFLDNAMFGNIKKLKEASECRCGKGKAANVKYCSLKCQGIYEALARFPKARQIAVENTVGAYFRSVESDGEYAAGANLNMDASLYGWRVKNGGQTMAAITDAINFIRGE